MNEIALQKRGRGRPAGSTSFVNIKLQDLIDNFHGQIVVSVSKKWLDKFDVSVEEYKPTLTVSSTTSEDLEPRIQFTLTH